MLKTETAVITSEELLNHWQGHRRLSRRVLEDFPEDKLFTHTIGGMRPYSELVLEMIQTVGPGIYGIATGKWETPSDMKLLYANKKPETKKDLLDLWDEVTQHMDLCWPQITPERFHVVEAAFGQYESTIIGTIFYLIDNEIHHRGQGYVYLRSLGITPPFFWERD